MDQEIREIVRKNTSKGDHVEDLSPMDPPSAYEPPGAGLSVPYEEMHPYLKRLRDEHIICMSELADFEACLNTITQQGPSENTDAVLNGFFGFVERVLLPHNQREEVELFGLLEERLLSSGEHSTSAIPGAKVSTAVDLMKSDHLQYLQISAVMTNFFGISKRLPDEQSRLYVLDAAVRQGRKLIEDLKLHIFREDEVLFSLAHNLIKPEEFDQMARLGHRAE